MKVLHIGKGCKAVFVPKGTHYSKVPPGCFEDSGAFFPAATQVRKDIIRYCESSNYTGHIDWAQVRYRTQTPFRTKDGLPGEVTRFDCIFYAPLDWGDFDFNELGEVAP